VSVGSSSTCLKAPACGRLADPSKQAAAALLQHNGYSNSSWDVATRVLVVMHALIRTFLF
jgi:hypothetical protein